VIPPGSSRHNRMSPDRFTHVPSDCGTQYSTLNPVLHAGPVAVPQDDAIAEVCQANGSVALSVVTVGG
jgi:hypothetical protein